MVSSLPPTPTRFTRISLDEDPAPNSRSLPHSPFRWRFGGGGGSSTSGVDDGAEELRTPYLDIRPPEIDLDAPPDVKLDLSAVAPLSPGVITEVTSPRSREAALIDQMFALNVSARDLGLRAGAEAASASVAAPSADDGGDELPPGVAVTGAAPPEPPSSSERPEERVRVERLIDLAV